MSACPMEWSGETGGPGSGNGTGTVTIEEMSMGGRTDTEWGWEDAARINGEYATSRLRPAFIRPLIAVSWF